MVPCMAAASLGDMAWTFLVGPDAGLQLRLIKLQSKT